MSFDDLRPIGLFDGLDDDQLLELINLGDEVRFVPGEELAYDYAYRLNERHTPAAKRRYPCTCGAPTCRGTMLTSKRGAP